MNTFIHFPDVTLTGFWGEKQRLIREVTIPYQWDALNDRVKGADRSGAVKNLKIAAGKAKGTYHGFVFQDSDLAKWIEAAACSLVHHPDPGLERTIDRLAALFAAAQADDGYLNTCFTIKEDPSKRWTDLRDNHEMYVAGHLLEAGVAYFQATGKRDLLDVSIRNVDLIASLFGRGKGRRRAYPGHPEIELALVRLFRVTQEDRFLELARYFVDERGRSPRYFDQETKRLGKTDFRSDEWHALYNQSHVPIREQKEVVGHAVRAGYLFSAAADIALETGDRELFRVVKSLYRNATERKMYLTGGVGSTLLGEAYTFDYDLPNEWAYAETCAAISLIFWSQRMLQGEVDGRYGDTMERVLYNGFLSALSADGTHCFYRNPLASKPDPKYPNRHIRRAWHECACCPPNVARLMMSLGSYFYSTSGAGLFVHLYGAGTANAAIKGRPVRISQETDYPWNGRIRLGLSMADPLRFRLALRIPAWCREATLLVNGEQVTVEPLVRKGYAYLDRTWRNGDTVTLALHMPAERVWAHPKVRQAAGKVAIQRGPVVYCLEEADNGSDLHEIWLPRTSELEVVVRDTVAGRVPVVRTTGLRRFADGNARDLYPQQAIIAARPVAIHAVPYFTWANRGMADMSVWMHDGPDAG